MGKIEVEPIEWWRASFGEIAPIGHVLRMHRSTDWLRLHSLPESKRYPETPDEMDEVLRRNESLAAKLFVTGEPIYIFRSEFHSPEESSLSATSDLNMFRAAASPAEPHDDDFFATTAETASWPALGFAEIIRAIANEEETMICFVSPASGNILCPYDGGVDSFTSEIKREQLSNEFSQWLSSHPLGL